MKKFVSFLILGIFAVGCQNTPNHIVLRESMYQSVRTERQFAKDTAAKLVIDPSTGKDHRDELTPLTQPQYDQLLKADQQFEDLINKDRQNDRISAQQSGSN